MKRHVEIAVTGYVQGVFFRAHTQEVAKTLQLTGHVENASDGTVHITAEGEEESLKKLLAWCAQGPRGASVEKVHHTFSDILENFTDFEVRYR